MFMAAQIGFDTAGLFCFYIETTYEIIINSINAVIGIPALIAQQIDSLITTAEYLILDTTASLLIGVEKMILKLLRKVDGIGDNDDSLMDQAEEIQRRVCEVAFNCQVVMEYFVSSGAISEADSTNYRIFENVVCASFPTLIREFFSYIKNYVQGVLDSARLALENWLNIEFLLAQWRNLVDKSGIISLIKELDKYSKCAFSVCDAASSSINAKENFYAKIGWDSTNPLGGYLSDIKRQADEKQAKYIQKAQDLQDILSSLDSLV